MIMFFRYKELKKELDLLKIELDNTRKDYLYRLDEILLDNRFVECTSCNSLFKFDRNTKVVAEVGTEKSDVWEFTTSIPNKDLIVIKKYYCKSCTKQELVPSTKKSKKNRKSTNQRRKNNS